MAKFKTLNEAIDVAIASAKELTSSIADSVRSELTELDSKIATLTQTKASLEKVLETLEGSSATEPATEAAKVTKPKASKPRRRKSKTTYSMQDKTKLVYGGIYDNMLIVDNKGRIQALDPTQWSTTLGTVTPLVTKEHDLVYWRKAFSVVAIEAVKTGHLERRVKEGTPSWPKPTYEYQLTPEGVAFYMKDPLIRHYRKDTE